MRYDYADRVMVVFSDGSRASYARKRYGDLLDKIVKLSEWLDRKIWNYYEIDGDNLYLYYWDQVNKKVYIGLLDRENVKFIESNYWTLSQSGYFHSRTNGKIEYLHQKVLGLEREAPREEVVDHINHNRIDNRKENLRLVSPRVNSLNVNTRNTYYDKERKKWRGRVSCRGKEYREYFDTEEEAFLWSRRQKEILIQQECSTTIPSGSRQ